ncbi:MAG: mannose-1-phosphate guanylyltransferase [Verrucomicrobia bacterium]|nr:mannose-1-phosphate guanylyltransferase [Verrucomicrobiota bacterium]
MKIIVLAGGSGKRLWPLVHPPKQFSTFIGAETLFQKTLRRFLKAYPPEDFVIVTGVSFLELAKAQAKEVHPFLEDQIIAENEPRNTAPAILFALEWLKERGELGERFLVTPSDHLVAPESYFLEKVALGEAVDSHVLFGIFPTQAHTGYGYIVCDPSKELTPVERFVEKPPAELAQSLLEKGNCLWNMGVFIFQTNLILDQPLEQTSIDYALLESAQNLKVIPLHLNWSDLGSWDSVYEVFRKDNNQNVVRGDVTTINSKNCLIQGNKKAIAAIDLEDLIVIDGEEGLLIAKRGSSEKVRNFQTPLDVAVQLHSN